MVWPFLESHSFKLGQVCCQLPLASSTVNAHLVGKYDCQFDFVPAIVDLPRSPNSQEATRCQLSIPLVAVSLSSPDLVTGSWQTTANPTSCFNSTCLATCQPVASSTHNCQVRFSFFQNWQPTASFHSISWYSTLYVCVGDHALFPP